MHQLVSLSIETVEENSVNDPNTQKIKMKKTHIIVKSIHSSLRSKYKIIKKIYHKFFQTSEGHIIIHCLYFTAVPM